MQINYPAGYTEEDFKAGRRISGVQLMEQTGLSLPEIQARGIQAFKEIVDKLEPPFYEKGGALYQRITGCLTSCVKIADNYQAKRRIILFFPESIEDMPNCFYIGHTTLKPEYEIEKDFPDHPIKKNKEEDPLFVAVALRSALIDVSIHDKPGRAVKTILRDWVRQNYPQISENQIQRIIDIVNDGYGAGGDKSLLKKNKK